MDDSLEVFFLYPLGWPIARHETELLHAGGLDCIETSAGVSAHVLIQ